jgi:predicted small secreted protein
MKRDRKTVRGGNMKRRIVAVVLATVLGAVCITGCGNTQETVESTVQAGTEAQTTQAAETAATESTEDADQAAADEVAAMIDAIYVQERTENTDKQCADAKAAWDALTDAQKELVEGENADPDYFGRDTGDASKDDPRNQDEIGENEILVVSFGTSFNDSRVADIKGIEDAIAAANPDWSVRRAFTAQIIINHIQARDDEHIDNMDQALDRAVANGVKNLVVQPTHLMHGAEYDPYRFKFFCQFSYSTEIMFDNKVNIVSILYFSSSHCCCFHYYIRDYCYNTDICNIYCSIWSFCFHTNLLCRKFKCKIAASSL